MKFKTRIQLAKWRIEDYVEHALGFDNARKAVKIDQETRRNFEIKSREIDSRQKVVSDELADAFYQINIAKRDIFIKCFSELERILSQLKDVVLPEDFCISEFKNSFRNLDEYTAIYEHNNQKVVDFESNKKKDILLAIITLGFKTRKKYNKSLNNAKINQDNTQSIIAEMEADLEKIGRCRDAAKQILHYFKELENLFNNTLQYLQHSINYLRYSSMRIAKKAKDDAISVTLLPKDLQNRLEATLILATVLSKLIKEKIIYDDKLLSEYQGKIKQEFDNIMSNSELKNLNLSNERKS